MASTGSGIPTQASASGATPVPRWSGLDGVLNTVPKIK
jgi:hypothetical protein